MIPFDKTFLSRFSGVKKSPIKKQNDSASSESIKIHFLKNFFCKNRNFT
jgi:hypothetical protein